MKGPPSYQIGLRHFCRARPIDSRFRFDRQEYHSAIRNKLGLGAGAGHRRFVGQQAIWRAVAERARLHAFKKRAAKDRQRAEAFWAAECAKDAWRRLEIAERRRRQIRSLFLHLDGDDA